jgi:uncharacterized protein (DUF1778 family)
LEVKVQDQTKDNSTHVAVTSSVAAEAAEISRTTITSLVVNTKVQVAKSLADNPKV